MHFQVPVCKHTVNWDNIITIQGASIQVVASNHYQPRVRRQVGPIFKNLVKINCEHKSETYNINETVKLHSCVLNARSVCNKACEIYELLSENSLDLLFITETWLQQDGNGTVIHDMLPDGYNILHQPRIGRRGGGTAVIHRDNLLVDQVSDNTTTLTSADMLECTTGDNTCFVCLQASKQVFICFPGRA